MQTFSIFGQIICAILAIAFLMILFCIITVYTFKQKEKSMNSASQGWISVEDRYPDVASEYVVLIRVLFNKKTIFIPWRANYGIEGRGWDILNVTEVPSNAHIVVEYWIGLPRVAKMYNCDPKNKEQVWAR